MWLANQLIECTQKSNTYTFKKSNEFKPYKTKKMLYFKIPTTVIFLIRPICHKIFSHSEDVFNQLLQQMFKLVSRDIFSSI